MSDSYTSFELRRTRCWVARAFFPSWKGFQNGEGAYGARRETPLSDGMIDVVFAPEGRGTEQLSDIELEAAVWVIENEAAIYRSIITALFASYPKLQEQYGYDGDEKRDLMPDIASPEDFQRLVSLIAVNIHQLQKGGLPYAGFEFACKWDEEHGLGVLLNGTSVVEIGQADTAILLWIARNDGGIPLDDMNRIMITERT